MAPGKVKVEDGALPRAAKIVAEAKVDLDREIKTLEGKLESMHWNSDAGTAFRTLMQRWRDDAQKVTGALDVFERNLLDSDTTYQQNDQQARDWLNKHAAGLGG